MFPLLPMVTLHHFGISTILSYPLTVFSLLLLFHCICTFIHLTVHSPIPLSLFRIPSILCHRPHFHPFRPPSAPPLPTGTEMERVQAQEPSGYGAWVKTALILSLVLWKPRDLELVSCDAMCLISLPPINLSASADWMVLNQFLTPNKGWREWAGKGAGVGSFCL